MAEGQRLFHQNAFGFARAEATHLHFGTIALRLSHSQLLDFLAFVSETLLQESPIEGWDARCIYLPTRDMAFMFALTYKELLLLDEILNQSILMIQIDKLLSN